MVKLLPVTSVGHTPKCLLENAPDILQCLDHTAFGEANDKALHEALRLAIGVDFQPCWPLSTAQDAAGNRLEQRKDHVLECDTCCRTFKDARNFGKHVATALKQEKQLPGKV